METWPALVAGIGSGLVGGFYLAFSLVVMPALRRLPGGAAASAMIAVNRAAVRAPFLVLFFGTALACPSCGSDRVRRRFSFSTATGSPGFGPAADSAGGGCCGGACGCGN